MIPQGALLSPHPRSWLSCCLKFLYVWLSLRSLWLIDFHDNPGSTPFPPPLILAIMLPQVGNVWLSPRSLWLIDFHDTPGSTPFPPSSNLAIILPQVHLCLTFFLQSIDFHDTLDHVTQIVHIDYYWLILFKFNSYLGILKSLANIPVWIWSHLYYIGDRGSCKYLIWIGQVEHKVLHQNGSGWMFPFLKNQATRF